MAAIERDFITREELLQHAKRIVGDALDDGMVLSVRKLYYDLVSEGLITADEKGKRTNYQRVSDTVARAKEAGEFPLEWLRDGRRKDPEVGDISICDLDVDTAEDEVRRALADAISTASYVSRWYGQPRPVCIMIEKDTVWGTIERPVLQHRIPYAVLNSYPSWIGSYAWFQQLVALADTLDEWGSPPLTVLYIGDHDPDGLEIPRTLADHVRKMSEITGERIPELKFISLALTKAQALALGAPSMGVKESSSRAAAYQALHGDDAWEVEAMPARDLRDLVDKTIASHFDKEVHRANQKNVARVREELIEKMREPGWLESAMEEID